MSGFSNPIIGGGGSLVYPSIHSPNYVPGSTGWSINKDGSAEFGSVIVRGSVSVSSLTAGTLGVVATVGGSGSLLAGTPGAARAVFDSTGLNLFDGANNNTISLNAATGIGTFTGKIQTGLSGQRIVVDPSGNPTLFFYPTVGADFAFINSPSGTSAIGVNSGTAGAGQGSRIFATETGLSMGFITQPGQAPAGGSINLLPSSGQYFYETGGVVGGGVVVNSTGVGITSPSTLSFVNVVDANVTGVGNTGINFSCVTGTAVFGSFNQNFCSFDGATAVLSGGGATSQITITSTTVLCTSTAFKATAAFNATTANAANVFVVAGGQLFRSTSSARYKVDIAPADIPTYSILELKPVTFVDRQEWEDNGESLIGLRHHLGLLAEDVATTSLGDLTVPRDDQGQPDYVEYTQLVVALVPAIRDLLARVTALEVRSGN